jgi:type I restriction enzyme S subunit
MKAESKSGYKMTDLGLIPSDWEVKDFGFISEKIVGGGTPSRIVTEFWGDEIPWVTVKDFSTFNPIKAQENITKLGLINSSTNLIPKGILITSTRMALGKAVIYDVDVAINQDLKAIFPKKIISTEFLFYWFQNNSKKIEDLGSGSTVMGLSLSDLRKVPFILPPLPEQTAIATTLKDTDDLINSLEKLIAKKKLIKQGAMQELLKPKEGWVKKKLGEVCEIKTGNKNNQDKIENGIYPFFVRSQKIENINTYSYEGEAILIPGEGNIGKIFHYINGKFDFHQRVYKISDFKDGYNAKYIFRFMTEYFGRHAMENSVKATVDSIRLPTIQTFEIPFPNSNEEQLNISNILGSIDDELESFETKLSKLHTIKQGMMQQLLTGKIRLV